MAFLQFWIPPRIHLHLNKTQTLSADLVKILRKDTAKYIPCRSELMAISPSPSSRAHCSWDEVYRWYQRYNPVTAGFPTGFVG